MHGFQVHFDVANGILICRIVAEVGLAQLGAFARVLDETTRVARSAGPLRVLWDASTGYILSNEATEISRSIVGAGSGPADRIAIIVHDFADRRAQLSATRFAHLFEDEDAARTWLKLEANAFPTDFTELPDRQQS